ncbi:hypothetical protein JTE90_003962 [Oedothorax gibbosus]|uniref:Uncharacterized protein n=1 Tax=Oedothorax gibbosus TaxID=931172 RepID=A0AAV6UWK6_9ARAC|nr:hypothetical protein JTE90_003962 [Oedothorax gibbosus]
MFGWRLPMLTEPPDIGSSEAVQDPISSPSDRYWRSNKLRIRTLGLIPQTLIPRATVHQTGGSSKQWKAKDRALNMWQRYTMSSIFRVIGESWINIDKGIFDFGDLRFFETVGPSLPRHQRTTRIANTVISNFPSRNSHQIAEKSWSSNAQECSSLHMEPHTPLQFPTQQLICPKPQVQNQLSHLVGGRQQPALILGPIDKQQNQDPDPNQTTTQHVDRLVTNHDGCVFFTPRGATKKQNQELRKSTAAPLIEDIGIICLRIACVVHFDVFSVELVVVPERGWFEGA